MAIDIIESKTTAGNSEVYEKIAEWANSRTAYTLSPSVIFLAVRASLPWANSQRAAQKASVESYGSPHEIGRQQRVLPCKTRADCKNHTWRQTPFVQSASVLG